jgi:DNA polymerase-1
LNSWDKEKEKIKKSEKKEKYNKVVEVPNVPDVPRWQLVTDTDEFEDIAEEIAMADHPVGLDLETYGRDPLNPRRSDIRFLQLSLPWRPVWLIDLQATGYDLGGLGEIIESAELVIHNARFDLGFLAHHLHLHPQRVFCTLTASRLLSAGTRQSNALGDVLRRYGIADIPKDQGASDWGAMLLTEEQLAYAVADVEHLHALWQRLEAELEKAGLTDVWAMETGLIPIVASMEATGFTVDRAALERIRDEHRSQAKGLGQQVQAALGATINPGSPEQLRQAFRAAGVDIDSTAEAILAEQSHPAAALTLSMRGTEKTAQQAQSLLDAMEADGRIHAQFDPTGTEAGRFSSKRPNLQNIGRGPLRGCFIAPEGRTLVCADYSQIELRVAAALANETRMIEAYKSGADLHRRTAALVLGKAEEDVTKDDRQLAKAVNFGLLYGQSAAGLVKYAKTSYGVDLTEGEAERIRDKFFRAYRGLAQWHGRMRDMAKGDTFTETRTRLGRRRLMPQGSDQFWQRFSGGLNTPVQGGAADGLKQALILLASRLPEDAAILSTVHDEIIVECPADQADAVARTMEDAMRQAMTGLYPEIPIEVEAHTGTTWAEAK